MADRRKSALAWGGLAAAIAVPLAAAATSPQLAWRDPAHIIGGFAGIIALGLLLVQPLLMRGMPGLSALRGRRLHQWVGAGLVAAIIVHVGGLWITSPPDMRDALLFVSPTPFAPFGVTSMWALFAVALLATLRRRWKMRPRTWRRAHMGLAAVIVIGALVHALLIEGVMEDVSKAVLCALVFAATLAAMAGLRGGRSRA